MMNATEAVTAMAARLGVEVEWSAFHANCTHRVVCRFLALASRAAHSEAMLEKFSEYVGELLDQGAGQAGVTDPETLDMGEAVAGWSASHRENQEKAIDQAIELVPQLREMGALR